MERETFVADQRHGTIQQLFRQLILIVLAVGVSFGPACLRAMADSATPPPSSSSGQSADTPPTVPCIASAAQGSDAGIVVHSTDPGINTQLSAGGTTPITISSPTTFYVAPDTNSQAVRYVYALARGSQVVASSDKPMSIIHSQIKIQHRTDTTPGLRSGPITLWIWGVDQINQISQPLRISLNVAGED